MSVEFINIDEVAYEDRERKYLLIDRDWGYNEEGVARFTGFSRMKFIDVEEGVNERLSFGFTKDIKEEAEVKAETYGLEFVYIS